MLTAEELQNYLHLQGDYSRELNEVLLAVVSLVESYHGDQMEWPEHIRLGAKMLAARVYRRRNSPAGVESIGELGPVYVQRNDPDLAQLLKIGRYAVPKVG